MSSSIGCQQLHCISPGGEQQHPSDTRWTPYHHISIKNFPTWKFFSCTLVKYLAAAMTIWAKIIESAVVYIHVFANATELDLLHVPDIQNRRSRRHAKKCSRWHAPTLLSELGKYIYVPTAAIIWTWCIGCILFLNIMLMGPHCWELVAYLVCLTWQYASILASGFWSAISYLASKLGSLARKIGATYQIIHRMYIALVSKSDQYGQNFFSSLHTLEVKYTSIS